MRRFLFYFSAATLFLYAGCKNDIDLLDKYKPFIVCYGLLNPSDSIQYVRVTKGFLGPENALTMAQEDSSEFPIGTVDVKMQRIFNNTVVETFQLVADTTIPRDSGIFVYPHQILYKGNFPVLRDGSRYKIVVNDLIHGNSATAETPIVSDAVITSPPSTISPLNLWQNTLINFRFNTGNNGYRYAFKVRFHYTDQFVFDTTETSQHYVDWDLGGGDAASTNGGVNMQFSVMRYYFLQNLANRIPEDPTVHRIAGNVDLIVSGAAQDFATYVDVQTVNNNTSADIPPFTNVNGGYGVLSSRNVNVFSGYWLDQDTRDALRNDPITQHLGFVR